MNSLGLDAPPFGLDAPPFGLDPPPFGLDAPFLARDALGLALDAHVLALVFLCEVVLGPLPSGSVTNVCKMRCEKFGCKRN